MVSGFLLIHPCNTYKQKRDTARPSACLAEAANQGDRPIHVHVVKGGAEARFQVQPGIALIDNKGLKPAELKLAEAIVEENREIITARWNEYFKK